MRGRRNPGGGNEWEAKPAEQFGGGGGGAVQGGEGVRETPHWKYKCEGDRGEGASSLVEEGEACK